MNGTRNNGLLDDVWSRRAFYFAQEGEGIVEGSKYMEEHNREVKGNA